MDTPDYSNRPDFVYYGSSGVHLEPFKYNQFEIVFNVNNEAGKNFIEMIADIPSLTATDFLLTLLRLENNNWIWDKEKLLGNEKGIYATDAIVGISTIASRVGYNYDETESIRRPFLLEYKPDYLKKNPYQRNHYLDNSGIEDDLED